MTAKTLRDLLAHLPDETEICIVSRHSSYKFLPILSTMRRLVQTSPDGSMWDTNAHIANGESKEVVVVL